MKPIPHATYPGMFYAVFPDGTPTRDFYNKSRAKDYTRRLEEYHRRYPNSSPEEGSRSLTDELKSDLGMDVAL